jgi:hypothetical protein
MKPQIFFGPLLVLLVSAPIGTTAMPQSAESQTMKMNKTTPANCPVTLPHNRTRPIYPMSLFGTSPRKPALILGPFGLWPEGTVVFRPGEAGEIFPDGSLSMKFGWTRAEGLRGKLKIHGRRLDALAPPLRANIPDGYGDTGFQATALIFPSEGCWKVTGEVGDSSLTFVTRVVRLTENNSDLWPSFH